MATRLKNNKSKRSNREVKVTQKGSETGHWQELFEDIDTLVIAFLKNFDSSPPQIQENMRSSIAVVVEAIKTKSLTHRHLRIDSLQMAFIARILEILKEKGYDPYVDQSIVEDTGRPELDNQDLTTRGTPRKNALKRSHEQLKDQTKDSQAEVNKTKQKLGGRIPGEMKEEFLALVQSDPSRSETSFVTEAIEDLLRKYGRREL